MQRLELPDAASAHVPCETKRVTLLATACNAALMASVEAEIAIIGDGCRDDGGPDLTGGTQKALMTSMAAKAKVLWDDCERICSKYSSAGGKTSSSVSTDSEQQPKGSPG